MADLQSTVQSVIHFLIAFVDIDEFLGKLKYLTKARLTAYRELLSAEDDLFRSSADIWGFDSLKQCTFEAEFYTDDQRNIPDKIKDLFLKTKSGKIGNLVCIGKDEEDLDIVLNLDSFTQKVKVFGTKDDLGFWIPNTVKLELLKELEK